jgi:hypothetical protein
LLSDTKNYKLVSRPTAEEERKVSHPVTVQDVRLIVVDYLSAICPLHSFMHKLRLLFMSRASRSLAAAAG